MRKHSYRANFILDTRHETEPLESLIEKIRRTLAELGASIAQVHNEGQKNFERVVNRHFSSGLYLEILFEGLSSLPAAIRSKFQLDRTVNRVLIERC
ncbi:MAG: 30S ribosomal protein S6 [Puniceicoccales bacterium]|jgi:ribosomal protein S6|nr:30S ribosomal protein S6 [Puniceicoccales bacterium]